MHLFLGIIGLMWTTGFSQNSAPGVFLPEKNRIVMQVESAPLTNPGRWVKETKNAGYKNQAVQKGVYFARIKTSNVSDIRRIFLR